MGLPSQISYVIPISGISKLQQIFHFTKRSYFVNFKLPKKMFCQKQFSIFFYVGPQAPHALISRLQEAQILSSVCSPGNFSNVAFFLPILFRIDFNNFLLRNVTPSEELQKIFCPLFKYFATFKLQQIDFFLCWDQTLQALQS